MKLNQLKSDLTKEQDGVWVEYGGGLSFLIARIRNPKMKDAMQRYQAKAARTRRGAIKDTEIDTDKLLQELAPYMAKYVLLDWKNLDDDIGKPIPYSSDKALEIFKDPAFEDILIFVLDASQDAALYRQQQLEAEAKNL